mgnify:FL=1
MITPISNNLNTASSLSSIERPRVPRRNNAVDSVSFTGKGNFSTGKVVSNIKGFFGKAFDSIKKGADSVIHSKFVQAVKNGTLKGFHKTVDIIKGTPKAIGNLFKKITSKFSKKA